MLIHSITRPWAKRLAHNVLCVPLRVNSFSELATHGRMAFWTCYRLNSVAGSVTESQKRVYHKVTNHHTPPLKFRFQNSSSHFLPTLPTQTHSLQKSSIARMSSVSTPGAPDEFRLPIDVKPTHYDLTVRTDLDKLQFEGFVKIRCVFEATLIGSGSLTGSSPAQLGCSEGDLINLPQYICPPAGESVCVVIG